MKRTDQSIRIYRIFILLSFLICCFLVASFIRPSWGAPGQINPLQQNMQHAPRLPDNDTDQKIPETEPTARQKQNLLKSNFEKTKDDATELADMAKGLRDELNKTSVNVLSLDVIHRAEKIEKLARKIKEEAKGY
jgi:hypothetical protein